ncbi:MAG: hypothetical protein RLZZ318_1348 [Bacteroidota bacterium]|jgi:hypothetical protein
MRLDVANKFLVILLLIISKTILGQNQNNWVVRNLCAMQNSQNLDSSEFAFHFDFNCEPPCYRELIGTYNYNGFEITRLTLSDPLGRLSLYSNNGGFYDNNSQLINNDSPNFIGYNPVLSFPTSSDSIILIIYKEDSLLYTLPINSRNHGETKVYYALFNLYTKKFIEYKKLIDFKDPRFQNITWNTSNTSIDCISTPLVLFTQYINEKTGNYYLFFNIGDTIYSSRYSKFDGTFSKPFYSGMDYTRNPNIKIKGTSMQGEKFKINFKGNYALFLNYGIREPFFSKLNSFHNNALIRYQFDEMKGKFSNETFLTTLNFDGTYQNIEYSPSDTVIYIASLSPRDSIIKLVFNNDYSKHLIYKIKLPLKLPPTYHTNLHDLKLGPNGKIYVLYQLTGMDTSILIIENPDDASPFIKFRLQSHLFKNHKPKVNCVGLDLYTFPITIGSYRKVKFSVYSTCKAMGMIFRNESDSFWFKKFRYYFGDGDSLDCKLNDTIVLHAYKKPGKYFVKLRAFDKYGATTWYSDTVIVRTAPSAYFTTQVQKGCQYFNYQFKDSSIIYVLKQDSLAKHWWSFGDGKNNFWQSSNKNERKDLSNVYYSSGRYSVTHIVSDGYCFDTFTRISGVEILPAPKPGMTVSDTLGCTPMSVIVKPKYKDIVDSTQCQISNGKTYSMPGQQPIQFTLNTAGKYRIIQLQYGPSGCITQDTMYINVTQGIHQNLIPQINYVNVTPNNALEINWAKVPNAQLYELYKDGKLLTTIKDTQYIDNKVAVASNIYHYNFIAMDVCKQKTLISPPQNNIVLKLENKSIDFAVLRWNAYLNWPDGVKQYNIFTKQSGNNYIINSTNDTSIRQFKDNDLLKEGEYQKCYQLEAIEKNTNQTKSYSNSLCIPYESLIWIPSAITINGDGINENLRVQTYGIQSFTFSVFNRWGEKVFQTQNCVDTWSPSPEQQGVYMYVIKAISNYGEYISEGTITVLR